MDLPNFCKPFASQCPCVGQDPSIVLVGISSREASGRDYGSILSHGCTDQGATCYKRLSKQLFRCSRTNRHISTQRVSRHGLRRVSNLKKKSRLRFSCLRARGGRREQPTSALRRCDTTASSAKKPLLLFFSSTLSHLRQQTRNFCVSIVVQT